MSGTSEPARRERTIQNEILLVLSKRYHPRGMFWTCDTGHFIPASEINRAVVLLKNEKTNGPFGNLIPLHVIHGVLKRLRRMVVGLPGQADIQGCIDGLWVGLEVKTGTGRQRKAQANFQLAIEKAGGVYAVVRSVEEAVAVIERTLATRCDH